MARARWISGCVVAATLVACHGMWPLGCTRGHASEPVEKTATAKKTTKRSGRDWAAEVQADLDAARRAYDELTRDLHLAGDLGPVTLKCRRVHIAPVTDASGLLQFEECLHVVIAMRSTDATKKVEYTGWAPGKLAASAPASQWATLTDGHGNRHRAIGHVLGLAKQQGAYAAVRPGEDTDETLYFERPIAGVERLTLTLPGAAVGAADESIVLTIPCHAAADRVGEAFSRVRRLEKDLEVLPADTAPWDFNVARKTTPRIWRIKGRTIHARIAGPRSLRDPNEVVIDDGSDLLQAFSIADLDDIDARYVKATWDALAKAKPKKDAPAKKPRRK